MCSHEFSVHMRGPGRSAQGAAPSGRGRNGAGRLGRPQHPQQGRVKRAVAARMRDASFLVGIISARAVIRSMTFFVRDEALHVPRMLLSAAVEGRRPELCGRVSSATRAALRTHRKGAPRPVRGPIALHGRRAVRSWVSPDARLAPPSAFFSLFETLAHEPNPCLSALPPAQGKIGASHGEADARLPLAAHPPSRAVLGPAARIRPHLCSTGAVTVRPDRTVPTSARSGTLRPPTICPKKLS
jgi:hypothetical protein